MWQVISVLYLKTTLEINLTDWNSIQYCTCSNYVQLSLLFLLIHWFSKMSFDPLHIHQTNKMKYRKLSYMWLFLQKKKKEKNTNYSQIKKKKKQLNRRFFFLRGWWGGRGVKKVKNIFWKQCIHYFLFSVVRIFFCP